jgi:GT2 family glycosyltransferase
MENSMVQAVSSCVSTQRDVTCKISIIVVTYNGYEENTRPCLESIFREPDGSDYEVIVVDNNSSDGTQAHLQEYARRENRLRLLLNKENRGFAGGNNDGIAAARGIYFVLLNNDTLVTRGWLSALVGTLESNPSVGLVGPISNAAGNEQNIRTVGDSIDEIISCGVEWTARRKGISFPLQRLCFFCVAMPRLLVENIGPLDENFGLGFYEDDDYCYRVLQAGYQIVCREDAFVYHRGSATFAKAPFSTKKLLRRNLRLLEQKHAISYRPRHPREGQLDLLESVLQELRSDRENLSLRWIIERRFLLLETLRPRGLFKRLGFDRKMNRLRAIFAGMLGV